MPYKKGGHCHLLVNDEVKKFVKENFSGAEVEVEAWKCVTQRSA